MTKATSIKIAALAIGLLAALTFIVAASTFAASVTEVQALPPAKAQAILDAEPSQRGAVASGGTGGRPCPQCE